jgi:transposase
VPDEDAGAASQHARLADQDAAAALARRVPGRAGVILFCASRFDDPQDVAAWLGVPPERLDELLRESEDARVRTR